MKNSRLGKFYIDRIFIDEYPNEFKRLFYNVFVIRAEFQYWNDKIEYIAISKYFDEIEEGCELPIYKFIFDRDKPYFMKAEKL